MFQTSKNPADVKIEKDRGTVWTLLNGTNALANDPASPQHYVTTRTSVPSDPNQQWIMSAADTNPQAFYFMNKASGLYLCAPLPGSGSNLVFQIKKKQGVVGPYDYMAWAVQQPNGSLPGYIAETASPGQVISCSLNFEVYISGWQDDPKQLFLVSAQASPEGMQGAYGSAA
ncbi:hypothetical protein [Corallococcus exiguus]|uniref:Uncharacterized protein n=1 Tax=Corallococcus exiguus TaxID=83462 RepID=A0A7X4Y651_9BACT|nr:hypothetical protein [Corallococcus exiguus]NBC39618.1 hypothetical protein [Corallococcus exiguus]TNV60929.1 hypothetical protein FH620_22845 [Corallococcus exiguus]